MRWQLSFSRLATAAPFILLAASAVLTAALAWQAYAAASSHLQLAQRVLRSLRERDTKIAVLVLTARGDEADKVRGLKLGADDYVTKPFGLLELLARVESLLRRAGESKEAVTEAFRFGAIEVDPVARRVRKAGLEVALRPKEYDLLLELLRHRGEVRSRLDLMQVVWGYSSAVITRTVDTHMFELRRKLEADAARPRHIMTVRGIGYRLDD